MKKEHIPVLIGTVVCVILAFALIYVYFLRKVKLGSAEVIEESGHGGGGHGGGGWHGGGRWGYGGWGGGYGYPYYDNYPVIINNQQCPEGYVWMGTNMGCRKQK